MRQTNSKQTDIHGKRQQQQQPTVLRGYGKVRDALVAIYRRCLLRCVGQVAELVTGRGLAHGHGLGDAVVDQPHTAVRKVPLRVALVAEALLRFEQE